MKRVYEERSYGKELVGYDYEGIFIERRIDFDGSKGLYGVERVDYICEELRPVLNFCSFDTLKECKMYIDEYLK